METAYVNLWNKRVGAVLWDEQSKSASFEYHPDFIKEGWDIAPIMMPLEAGHRIFRFSELARSTTFKGMPGLLADVMPDRYGNALINTWLARNGRTANSMNPVEMLCFVGSRGMGAMEFEPVVPDGNNTATRIEIDGLINIAQRILNDREGFNGRLGKDDEKDLLDILKIGTSAGGARAKALIAWNERTGEVRSGQSDAPKGFDHWLMKFDGVHDSQFGSPYGYGRVEMAYYSMATACGIEMMESRLYEESDRAHFMTKRFDRIAGKGKLHVQSWCAMAHYDFQDVGLYSYEQLFETMRGLGLPYTSAEQMFRRMVFNVIARNCDDHTKNFAFTMNKENEWVLAPAYDVCHAYRPGSIWVSQQSLTVNGKRKSITKSDFLSVAKSMNIKKSEAIVSEIQSEIDKWEYHAKLYNVNKDLTSSIKNTLLKLV